MVLTCIRCIIRADFEVSTSNGTRSFNIKQCIEFNTGHDMEFNIGYGRELNIGLGQEFNIEPSLAI